ncbi:deoxyribonuclease IV [Kribbella sp. NPDC005582]|uniref:deoxyribonuclease IV n=1 Tax=Kribbella sp. NPDC005582 TaxID=3156893 RepID=UPI0033AA8945
MPLIGSHVMVGRGLVKGALAEAVTMGAEIIQLFGGNPRSWAPRGANPAADEAFRTACAELQLPVVVHAPHLINLCSPSDQVLSQSLATLELTMDRAAAIGARTVVVHAGSLVDGSRRTPVLKGLHDLLSPIADRDDVQLLIEPTAGGGESAASTVGTTIDYMLALDNDRIGLCLDTCHLHAAGEDPVKAVDALTEALGPTRLALLHLNDSRDPAGSRRDRHESIGKGTLGLDTFTSLLNNPHLDHIPMLVETPTNAEDVALLKTLRGKD